MSEPVKIALILGLIAIVLIVITACSGDRCDESDAGENCNEWSAL